MTNTKESSFSFDPKTYSGLDKLGRIPLSKNLHMREFLYSEVAIFHGVLNVPDDVKKAVATGSKLCEYLLEPLQEAFGRIHVRSGYRSRAVNQAGLTKNCASDNDGFHTWDHSHEKCGMGATAYISIPSLSKKILTNEVEYQAIAWWIIDHLPEWGSSSSSRHQQVSLTPMRFVLTLVGTRNLCVRSLHDAVGNVICMK